MVSIKKDIFDSQLITQIILPIIAHTPKATSLCERLISGKHELFSFCVNEK